MHSGKSGSRKRREETCARGLDPFAVAIEPWNETLACAPVAEHDGKPEVVGDVARTVGLAAPASAQGDPYARAWMCLTQSLEGTLGRGEGVFARVERDEGDIGAEMRCDSGSQWRVQNERAGCGAQAFERLHIHRFTGGSSEGEESVAVNERESLD